MKRLSTPWRKIEQPETRDIRQSAFDWLHIENVEMLGIKTATPLPDNFLPFFSFNNCSTPKSIKIFEISTKNWLDLQNATPNNHSFAHRALLGNNFRTILLQRLSKNFHRTLRLHQPWNWYIVVRWLPRRRAIYCEKVRKVGGCCQGCFCRE